MQKMQEWKPYANLAADTCLSLILVHTQNLDIQYTVGVATEVPVEFISVGIVNTDGIDGFLDEVNFLINQKTVPTVLTTSYGFDEDSVSENLAKWAFYLSLSYCA